jgi:hypothetical protein
MACSQPTVLVVSGVGVAVVPLLRLQVGEVGC